MNAAREESAAGGDAQVPPQGRLRADPRLPAYLVGGFGALVVAIATGQAELAALAAPFLALAAAGLAAGRPSAFSGELTLSSQRVIEDDGIDGAVRLDWDGVAEVDVTLTGLRGVTPVEPAPHAAWALPAGRGPVTLPFRLRARAWGEHRPGTLWVRARRPGGLLVWEEKLGVAPPLRVLPAPLRLDRLLKPAEPRAVAGVHIARIRGQGTDFAELRPYQPGDRLRDVSWSTSARLGRPWVAVHHPERTGTVLLLLDAFATKDRSGREALARAARAAWAVAAAHLQAQDRVGLLSRGETIAWLPPRGGRRGRWLLLDTLLSVGGDAEDPWRSRRRDRRATVPSDALVVGLTSLGWPAFVRELLHYRRIGHATVALVIDTSDLLPEPRDDVDLAALRIWRARRDAERSLLDRGGVPSAIVTVGGGPAPAIAALRRHMNAFRRTGGVVTRTR